MTENVDFEVIDNYYLFSLLNRTHRILPAAHDAPRIPC